MTEITRNELKGVLMNKLAIFYNETDTLKECMELAKQFHYTLIFLLDTGVFSWEDYLQLDKLDNELFLCAVDKWLSSKLA